MRALPTAALTVLLLVSCKTVDSEVVPRNREVAPQDVVLADLNFERPDIAPWEAQFNKGNFARVQDADSSRNYCGMFQLGEQGDYWTSPANGSKTARSEIQLLPSGACEEILYYRWDFKIASEYVESSDWQIIGQFHDQPDPSQGESWATYPKNSPPLALRYRNGELIVAVYSWDKNGVIDIARCKVEKNRWHTLDLKVFWSVGKTGTIEAWLNGESLQAPDGQSVYVGRNCFNRAGNYLKIGLYRSNDIMTKGTVYYDNVRSSHNPLDQ